jgi:hypothetical protein
MRNEIELPLSVAKENFRYFKQNIGYRMEAFRGFMKTFSIDAKTDDRGLAAVSTWFGHSGGLLLYYKPRDTTTLHAFVSYDPPWIGRHIGINILWDIGTYVGECIIARRQSAHWDINTGGPDPLSREGLGFHRPHIEGLYWPVACDPITHIFVNCNGRMAAEVRSKRRLPTIPQTLLQLVGLWSKPNPRNPGQTA